MIRYRFFIQLLIAVAFFSSCKKDEDIPVLPEANRGCGIDFLKGNLEFSNRINLLRDNAMKLDYETGYILYPSKADTYRYELIEGRPGAASIVFDPKLQVDGLIHSHYGDLYPNFSGSDIKAIYEAYYYEKINDYKKFVCAVVSGTNTAYLLKITDLNTFIGFSKQNLTDKNSFATFETIYHNIQEADEPAYGLNLSFENALLEMLNSSGLTLYKSVLPFQSWNRLDRNVNGQTQRIPCW
ncbi:hypothetical protein ACR79R_03105 [Sphingobacterium spiritivorum]|uniref:hypothetical protein n=1 Tax=Sphingobacterium spiritivorum TaxID=258 RepID=UPI003DA679E8